MMDEDEDVILVFDDETRAGKVCVCGHCLRNHETTISLVPFKRFEHGCDVRDCSCGAFESA